MSRRYDVFTHVGSATRTSAGAATAGIACGEYLEGQLLIHCTGLGAGGKLTPYWQSSRDGVSWGDLTRGATMTATGVKVIAQGFIGAWARCRWAIATSAKFRVDFVFKE
jgi:hypothetical protein